MTDQTLLQSLGLILLAATLLMLASRVLKVPTIVAYIVAGLLLGPIVGLLAASEEIHLISEIGIILLLFLVGLELSLERIKDVGGVALAAGSLQMLGSGAIAFGAALLAGFEMQAAAFIGVALAFSSTVVVVKLLEQKRELHSLYGRIAVGILLVQDLAVILVLTFLAGLGGGGEGVSAAALARGLGGSLLGMVLLLGVAIAASRYLLPRLFGWLAISSEALFISSLCWCFLLVIGAELLELSPEIGAFLAGISLAQLPYSHNLRRRVHPLMNFFIAVFFVSLGIEMELSAASAELLPVIILTLAVLLGKPLVLAPVLAWKGHTAPTPLLTGITLAQSSEFSFIMAALGLSIGLIDEATVAVIGLVGLGSIAISSYAILYNHRLARLAGRGEAPAAGAGTEGEHLEGHVIVVGVNALGKRVIRQMMQRGETVLAVDTDQRKLADLPCRTLLGSVDHESVLEEANLARARLLVSALQIEDTNNLLAYHCRRAGVPSSIHAFDRSVVAELRRIGVSHLMMSKNSGVQRIAAALRERGVLSG